MRFGIFTAAKMIKVPGFEVLTPVGMKCYVFDVSEEHFAYKFRVEEEGNQETSGSVLAILFTLIY
jgi:hypothetical protein